MGVEHLLRDIKDTTVGTLSQRITNQLLGLKGLHSQIKDIRDYLVQVCFYYLTAIFFRFVIEPRGEQTDIHCVSELELSITVKPNMTLCVKHPFLTDHAERTGF